MVGSELAIDHLLAHGLSGVTIGLDGTISRTSDLAEAGLW